MDQFNADNLPPDLEEVGKRMSRERPVASDRALRNVMTRAQSAGRTRKFSLLWRSSAPRAPRKAIGFSLVAIVATVGFAGAANAFSLPILGNLLGSSSSQLLNVDLNTNNPTTLKVNLGKQNAPVIQYADCPLGLVRVVVSGNLVDACVVVLPVGNAACPAGGLIRVNLPLAPLVTACVRVLP